MNNNDIKELKHENNALRKEINSLRYRLEKMQKSFAKQHEELRELRIKLGARKIGPHK